MKNKILATHQRKTQWERKTQSNLMLLASSSDRKHNDKYSPDKIQQHADCILPGEEPFGFYGGGGDASSSFSGSGLGSSVNP